MRDSPALWFPVSEKDSRPSGFDILTLLENVITQEDVSNLSDDFLRRFIAQTMRSQEWIKAQTMIVRMLYFKDPPIYTTIIDRIYHEYFLRILQKSRADYRKLGVSEQSLCALNEFKELKLSWFEKEIVLGRLFDFAMKQWVLYSNNIWGLDLSRCQVSIEWNLVQIIVSDQHTRQAICELHKKKKVIGFSKALETYSDNFSWYTQVNYAIENTSVMDTQTHESWHAIDRFRGTITTDILGEGFSWSNGSLYQLNQHSFHNPDRSLQLPILEKSEIIPHIHGLLKTKTVRAILWIKDNQEVHIDYSALQFELPAFIASHAVVPYFDKIHTTEILSITRQLMMYISPFRNMPSFLKDAKTVADVGLLEEWRLTNEDSLAINKLYTEFSLLLEKFIKNTINAFNQLATIRWDSVRALVEISLLPVNRREAYVYSLQKKHKQQLH